MRINSLTLAVWCVSAGLALAQTPKSPGVPAKPTAQSGQAADTRIDPRNELDSYLLRWEEAMKKVSSLGVSCTRTEIDKTYNSKKIYTGTIHFLKPTFFFWHLAVREKPTDYEHFVCTGTYIYQYLPSQKEIRVYKAPKTTKEGRLADDSSLAFLFGMKAAEAKSRYKLTLFKTDENYIYVDVEPRTEVDFADFKKARLILDRTTYLPRTIWFQHPNTNEVLWDLPTVQVNPKLKQELFAAPKLPAKDWKMVQGQAPGQPQPGTEPRVYRPQSK